ncbi:MAG: hypothetical protein [Chaetfec virus UA24_2285]|nr:MAG: hypothetical protein [Chaetfec virus UA24_2285]
METFEQNLEQTLSKDGPLLYEYRYFIRFVDPNGKLELGIRHVIDTLEGVAVFDEALKNDPCVRGCYREYVKTVEVALSCAPAIVVVEEKENAEE